MKKLLCLLFSVFLLSGCTKITVSVQNRLEEACRLALNASVPSVNNRKQFYAYYLDPSLGRVSSTLTGNEFRMGSVRFVMNLDVARLINEKYYPEETVSHIYAVDGNEAAYTKGTLINTSNEELPYEIHVIQVDEDIFAVCADAGYMSFQCMCNLNDVPAAAGQMLMISRSVTVDRQEIMNAFTTLEGITYAGTPVELFEEKVPENGSIEELLIDYEGRKTQPEESSENPETVPEDGQEGVNSD